MDLNLIVKALLSGALIGMKQVSNLMATDAYEALKKKIVQKVPSIKGILENIESKSEISPSELKNIENNITEILKQSGVVKDPEIVRLSEQILIKVTEGYVYIVNNNQRNYFTMFISKTGLKEERGWIEAVIAKLDEYDKKVASVLKKDKPIKVISQDRDETFDSRKLVKSLLEVGVPLDAAFRVLESVVSKIVHDYANKESLTSSEIRKMVFEALTRLDTEYSLNQKHTWSDNYARRYGNPYERVKIINDDGSIAYLDFDFVHKKLIPEIVSNLYEEILSYIGEDSKQRRWEPNSIGDILQLGKDANVMAKEIIEMIKRLNLYEINYETVLNLTIEIATQPPHPWFIRKPFDLKYIQYDLERASAHYKKIKDLLQKEASETPEFRHEVAECLHHISSATLGFYGMFLGVGQLRPFYKLSNWISSLREKEPFLWGETPLHQIEGDLKAIGIPIGNLAMWMDRSRSMLYAKGKGKDLGQKVINIYDTLNQVIKRHQGLRSHPLCTRDTQNKGKFVNVVKEMLASLPRNRILKELYGIDSMLIILKHRWKEISDEWETNQWGNYLIVGITEKSSNIEKLITRIKDSQEKSNGLYKLGIIFGQINKIGSISHKYGMILSFGKGELCGILKSVNRIHYLNELIEKAIATNVLK